MHIICSHGPPHAVVLAHLSLVTRVLAFCLQRPSEGIQSGQSRSWVHFARGIAESVNTVRLGDYVWLGAVVSSALERLFHWWKHKRLLTQSMTRRLGCVPTQLPRPSIIFDSCTDIFFRILYTRKFPSSYLLRSDYQSFSRSESYLVVSYGVGRNRSDLSGSVKGLYIPSI